MTEIVFAHEGTVAKVMGDGMHILFNAPGDQPDYATRAIACAHDLDGWAAEFRKRWRAKGVNFGATRIGVHAGPVLVGNFGGSRFSTIARTGTPSTPRRGSRLPTAQGRAREPKANKITKGKSNGWSLIYCKGPEGEQLEFVQALDPVKQTFQEALERRRQTQSAC